MGLRIVLACVALVAGAYGLDEAVWLARGLPVGQVAVSVVTAMEFKNGKEDYGDPELDTVPCTQRALPAPNAQGTVVPPCWWVQRHTEVVRRP